MKPRLEDMTPELLDKYLLFQKKMTDEKIPFGLTCVIRSHAEQEAFFAQGREPLDVVNAKRMTAGMAALKIDPVLYAQSLIPGSKTYGRYIVTHTINSRHFPDASGKSRAFDIAIIKNGRTPTWEEKFDADKDNIPDYLEAATIGKAVGLVSGGLDFGKVFHDWPHFEEARI